MNRDDIIRMAREAGIDIGLWEKLDDQDTFFGYSIDGIHENLERFAALVAAHEREKVANWQIGSGYSTGHGETIEDLLVELEWQVRESERVACAKLCQQEIDRVKPLYSVVAENVLKGIVARGQE